MNSNLAAIILAAGRGKRMKSPTPKALHHICARPMLDYVLDLAEELKIRRKVVVLGYKHQEVKKVLRPGVRPCLQKRLLGTADALKLGLKVLGGFRGTVLVLYADIPLLRKETIKELLEYHQKNNLDATVLTANTDKPEGYGRVMRDKYSGICRIVEEADADDFQKGIKEVNTGIICFKKERLAQALRGIRPRNRKNEYYLTDAINILYQRGCLLDTLSLKDISEALGINSRVELAQAEALMRQRINREVMKSGVSVVDPASTFIGYGAKIGRDSVIYPFTVIERDVKIGKRCLVGPFAHLRQGTRLEDDCIVGNFLEIVRSRLSRKTWARHFAYLGDSLIGSGVNIGAGTVTANYDGRHKFRTVIKDKAFVGSDSVLVAPVTIGKAAKTGAGAVVIKHTRVKDNAVVVGVPARPLESHKLTLPARQAGRLPGHRLS
jgi:bifunctional UDP-N-acetylglucosamine pyrophosphorylase/glucosamine-1-phosphate N-acetyltransferase